MGLFFRFLFGAHKKIASLRWREALLSNSLNLIEQPYSHDQVEKSFSYCGTSFQTPFSFLLVMVISCGW